MKDTIKMSMDSSSSSTTTSSSGGGFFSSNTFRKFPFRSQSLRFKRSSSTSSAQGVRASNVLATPKSTSLRQKPLSTLSASKVLNNASSLSGSSQNLLPVYRMMLDNDGRDLIITNTTPSTQECSQPCSPSTCTPSLTPPICTTNQKPFKLTRHQSIKSFYRSTSNQSLQSQKLQQTSTGPLAINSNHFIIANAPPLSLIDSIESNNNNHIDHHSSTSTMLNVDDYPLEDNYHFDLDEGVVDVDEDDDEQVLDDVDSDLDNNGTFGPGPSDGGSSSLLSSSSSPQFTITTSYRKVRLYRHPRLGLGISIIGGCDQGPLGGAGIPVTVVAIKPNSPAQRLGDIYIGDQIISVNEVPLNEDTSHQDALRLLSQCGTRVTLVLKHSKAVMNFTKKWKHHRRCSMSNLIGSGGSNDQSNRHQQSHSSFMNHSFPSMTTRQPTLKDYTNNKSDNEDENGNHLRINLFLANISQYISYSDRIRDAAFELHHFTPTADQTSPTNQSPFRSLVVQCLSKDLCYKWFRVIKRQIHQLNNSFIQNFNKHLPESGHFLYNGFITELVVSTGSSHEKSSLMSSSLLSVQSSPSKLLPQLPPSNQQNRWLTHFLIIKGGKVYLFKMPPVSLLVNYKRKISALSQSASITSTCQNEHKQNGHIQHQNNRSNGSSLGSVAGSSSTTSSVDESATITRNTQLLVKNRLLKLNRCLENELELMSLDCWHCYNSDFRPVPLKEQRDEKDHCFVIYNSKNSQRQRYFSTECKWNLDLLTKAWNVANYNSVIKFDNKIYTVTLEKSQIVGSFKIDWNHGFSFYDPRRNICLWRYPFHQLKQSSDNGRDLLSLTFVVDPNDSRVTETHLLRCSCLQTVIYCIHSFLQAKVYSLYL